jgi:hypothetical protein
MTLKTFVRENNWLPRGFMGRNFGWGNGYVIIPEGHPMYGKHYDDIPVEVNGGLTFAENVSDMNREHWPEIPEDITSGWVVGFDTAHSWDTLSRWPKEKVERETNRLRLQLEKLSK